MVSVKEARNLTQEIAELLQGATTEEKLQIKGILIGAKFASVDKSNDESQTMRVG